MIGVSVCWLNQQSNHSTNTDFLYFLPDFILAFFRCKQISKNLEKNRFKTRTLKIPGSLRNFYLKYQF